MRSVAGHGVVGVALGELEIVVIAVSAPRVFNVATETGDDSGLAGRKVRDRVQVALAGSADFGGSELKRKLFYSLHPIR